MRLNLWVAAVTVICLSATPAFSEITGNDMGKEQIKNVQTGARNASTGWVEIFDSVAEAQSKAKNTAEKCSGLIAGAGIGTRKALHKTGAGLIDLGTFWMPKKEALLITEKDKALKPTDKSQSGPTQNFSVRRDR